MPIPATINVRSFGAIGDGITDDTDAILNAFVFTANGCLYFPSGLYLITRSIACLAATYSVTIKGDGPMASVIMAQGNFDAISLEFARTVQGES